MTRIVILFTTLFYFTLPSAYADDWPQLQRDPQRTGYYPARIKTASIGYRLRWTWHPPGYNGYVASNVQPVVAQGIVVIGAYDAKMYALDALTGEEKWAYQTGGPILHTAAIDNGRVFFGSQDGRIYALNLADGAKIWEYQTGKGIAVAPAVIDGRVLIGSKDSYFYAFDENSGRLLWRYKTGGPILNSPAAANGVVYFGSEDMYVYALDYTTVDVNGRLVWRSAQKLNGQSMSGYWPVISLRHSSIVLRTMPYIPHAAILNNGDYAIEFRDDMDQTNDKARPTTGNPLGTPELIAAEQDHLVGYLNDHPEEKTFFALDLANGQIKYTAPMIWTGGCGNTAAPITLDEQGNRTWVVYRSYYSRFDSSCTVRSYADIGKMDLGTGRYTPFGCSNPSGPCNACVMAYEDFHLVGDEMSYLSSAQNALLVGNAWHLGGLDLETERSFHVVAGPAGPSLVGFNNQWPSGSFDDRDFRSTCGHNSMGVIADGRIYWMGSGSLMGMLE